MTKKPVVLGEHSFVTKEEARKFIQWVLKECGSKSIIDVSSVTQALRALLQFHPDYSSKLDGRQITSFFVDLRDHGSRCFYFIRDDGTRDHFSYKKCFDNM